jgi:hypothetical protein
MRFRYAMLYDGRDPVAAISCHLLELDSESYGSETPEGAAKPADGEKKNLLKRGAAGLKNAAGKLLRRAAEPLSLRLMICGNAFLSGEHGISIRDHNSLDSAERADRMHGVADALFQIRRAEKLRGGIGTVMAKDFYSDAQPTARALRRFGYHEFEVDPNMIVTVDPAWKTFEGYVGAMNKKYRGRTRSMLKKFNKLERRDLSADDLVSQRDAVWRLYSGVHAKAKFRIVRVVPGYFEALKRGLGDDFRVSGFYRDGEMVGFTTQILWGESVEGHSVGLDYAHNNDYAIYMNLLLDDVRLAIEDGRRDVLYGRTALEVKSAVGAKPAPMSCFVRQAGAVSNRMLKPLVRFLKPSTWTPRHPFGDAAEEGPDATS